MPKHRESEQDSPSFTSNKSGLYLTRSGGSKHKVCDGIKVNALAEREIDGLVFVELMFIDICGRSRRLRIGKGDLLSHQSTMRTLADHGFNVPSDTKDRKELHRYLNSTIPEKRRLLLTRTGWVKDRAFLFPTHAIGEDENSPFYDGNSEHNLGLGQVKGSIKAWNNEVLRYALHSPICTLAIGTAFAAPLLRLTNTESFGFHFVGPSSIGKSTSLRTAQTVFGSGSKESLLTWDVTETGLEELAAEHCDLLLALDEIDRLSPDAISAQKKAQDASFRICGGQPRVRSKRYTRDHPSISWRTALISSGEKGLTGLAQSVGVTRLKGDEVRLIDVPAQATSELGVFRSLPDDVQSSNVLAKKIEAACSRNYGRVGRAFVGRLIDNPAASKEAAEEHCRRFLSKVGADSGAWETRFASRFALSYAGMLLAHDFGLITMEDTDIFSSIRSCYSNARSAIADFTELTDVALSNLRASLSKGRHIIDLTEKDRPASVALNKAYGFLRQHRDGFNFYAVPRRKLSELCKTDLPTFHLMARLNDMNILLKDSHGKLTRQVEIPGLKKKSRYVCIKDEFLQL